jgi:acyl-coenzyme A synthetase/AMP-(fatty) acid ligase
MFHYLISKIENIKEVSVRGYFYPFLGQIVVAEIVTNEPESLVEIKMKVRKACGEALAPFKVPSKIIISERDMYSKRMKKIRKEEV